MRGIERLKVKMAANLSEEEELRVMVCFFIEILFSGLYMWAVFERL